MHCHIYQYAFSLFFLLIIVIYGILTVTSLCVLLIPWHFNTFLFVYRFGCVYLCACVCVCLCVSVCVCVYHLSVIRCLRLCTLSNANVHKLDRVSVSTHSSPEWGILRLAQIDLCKLYFQRDFLFVLPVISSALSEVWTFCWLLFLLGFVRGC